MTEPLREQIARLRELAPKLNDVTDRAAKLVLIVEKLLVEELSVGIPCRALIKTDTCNEYNYVDRTYIVFDRYEGKFRRFVEQIIEHDGGPPGVTSTLWAALPRDTKLASFQKIPDLLADLTTKVEKAIAETEGAGRTIMDLVKAIGEPTPSSSKSAPSPPNNPGAGVTGLTVAEKGAKK